jgi:hypothetical protein
LQHKLGLNLSKLVLSHDNQVWLVHLKEHPRVLEVLDAENVGCSLDQSIAICCDTLCNLPPKIKQQPLQDWDLHNYQATEEQLEHHVQTRSGKGKARQPAPGAGTLRKRNAVMVMVDPITNWMGNQNNLRNRWFLKQSWIDYNQIIPIFLKECSSYLQMIAALLEL